MLSRRRFLASAVVLGLAARVSFAADTPSLIEAIRSGDIAVVRRALADGADVNQRDADDITPLMAAAHLGRPDLVQLLLDQRAEINARDAHGRTALHHLLRTESGAPAPKKKRGFGLGSLGKVGDVLKNGGVVPDARSLANRFKVDGLKSLLNTSLDFKDPAAWTRQIQSLAKERPDALSLLTGSASANPQWAALVDAAAKGDTDAVQRVIGDGGANGTLDSLRDAARIGLNAVLNATPGPDSAATIARMLMDRGADVDVIDENGETAGKRARAAGLNAVADLLQKKERK